MEGLQTQSLSTHTFYFAYGSNLWLSQMRRRCPSSVYLGVGRLRSSGGDRGSRGGWRWIINERGYANVVEVDDDYDDEEADEAEEVEEAGEEQEGGEQEREEKDEVYGFVYALPSASAEEASLDAAEGVPFAYGKEYHDVDFWPCAAPEGEGSGSEEDVSPAELFVDVANIAPRRLKKRVLVYVDRLRTAESVAGEEYVDRMNEAMKDAVTLGVPQKWVDGCVRRFVPVA